MRCTHPWREPHGFGATVTGLTKVTAEAASSVVQSDRMASRVLVVVVACAVAAVTFWFALVHTLHMGTLAIPDLSGKTLDEAARSAHDLGLAVEVEEPGVYSASVEPGLIGAQEPYPGFHVKTGSKITVRLSLGSERVSLASLGGESVQGAELILEQLGLRLAGTAQVNGQGPGDVVIATDPPLGEEVPPGTEIKLLVNVTPARELWVMPSLVTLSSETVERFLRRAGLRLGQVHRVAYPGIAGGTVLRQYPPSGSPLSRSDIVTLWVSQ